MGGRWQDSGAGVEGGELPARTLGSLRRGARRRIRMSCGFAASWTTAAASRLLGARRGQIWGQLENQFPANREKNREFLRFSRLVQTSASKTYANSVACEMSSLRDRTGN